MENQRTKSNGKNGAMKSEDYGTDNLHLLQTMRLRQSEARVTTAKRLTLNGKNKGAPSENKKNEGKRWDGLEKMARIGKMEKWKKKKETKKATIFSSTNFSSEISSQQILQRNFEPDL